ncbi:MAG: SDR family oxidoreductase [Pseudomonadota bacterium]
MEMQGKVAVVTGGAQGLGLAAAKMFAEGGARVVIMDINPDAFDEAIAEIGGEVLALECNVANEASVVGAFQTVADTFGRLDYAVLNAGILRDGLLVKVDRETGEVVKTLPLSQWQSVIDVNLTGVFLTGREAAKHMITFKNGGVIVPMSSIARHGNVGQTNYAAAKAGVATLAATWGKELGRYGIRTVAVAPGLIGTRMVLKEMKQEILDRFRKVIPVGRLGTPEDIAHTIRYIIENGFLNATVVEPSGGMSF